MLLGKALTNRLSNTILNKNDGNFDIATSSGSPLVSINSMTISLSEIQHYLGEQACHGWQSAVSVAAATVDWPTEL